jgi:hypothetical protein
MAGVLIYPLMETMMDMTVLLSAFAFGFTGGLLARILIAQWK